MITKQTIFNRLHQLPVMPLVVHEVMDSFRDSNAGSAAMAHKIALDQGLSSRVLRVANSSFYGLSREVGSIQDAVTVLGFDTIRSLVVSAGVTQAFPATADSQFDRRAYWMRSIRVATYTEALSKCMGRGANLAFTSGLFHDVGQLVLSICIPTEFAQLLAKQVDSGRSLIEIERSELGFDHAEIGGEMAKRWSFPLEIEYAIKYWRTPWREPFAPVTGMVRIAVALEDGLRGAELIESLPPELLKQLPVNWEAVQRCLPDPEELDSVARLMLDE